jgi:hypothetical protein
MSNEKIPTYFDSSIGDDLSPGRTRLLFAAYIDRSPIDSEEIEYRVGPSKCDRFDVLWRKSDWNNEDSTTAMSWLPRQQISGKELHVALLEALFKAEKENLEIDEPNFSEIIDSKDSLLSTDEAGQLAARIFSDRQG